MSASSRLDRAGQDDNSRPAKLAEANEQRCAAAPPSRRRHTALRSSLRAHGLDERVEMRPRRLRRRRSRKTQGFAKKIEIGLLAPDRALEFGDARLRPGQFGRRAPRSLTANWPGLFIGGSAVDQIANALRPGLGPRLRFSPATPNARQADRHWYNSLRAIPGSFETAANAAAGFQSPDQPLLLFPRQQARPFSSQGSFSRKPCH